MPCAQHCGLEVLVEKNRIVKVRPDKDNPRSQGYVCRKGLNVSYHQHHKQRLTHPLKRTDRGFTVISWDQAIDEISHKLRSIIDEPPYGHIRWHLAGVDNQIKGACRSGIFPLNLEERMDEFRSNPIPFFQ
ncbi:MAG: molybdopterin-dependent oxidoreductase [Deltaproteobacteria bacterium]|nr:molybdopterin-dependent oxidoreductase [Deltaproteobacteria bacterium]